MERYETAFYAPIVADLSNFGSSSENSAPSSQGRAVHVWELALHAYRQPKTDAQTQEIQARFIES